MRAKSFQYLLLSLLLSFTLLRGAFADAADKSAAPAADQVAIQALYDRSNAAAAKKDIDGQLAHLTADFVSVDTDGDKSDRAKSRADLVELYKVALSVQGKSLIKTFESGGDRATVTVEEHIEIVAADSSGQKKRLVFDDTAKDLWIKVNGAWKLKQSTNLTESAHVVKE